MLKFRWASKILEVLDRPALSVNKCDGVKSMATLLELGRAIACARSGRCLGSVGREPDGDERSATGDNLRRAVRLYIGSPG